MWFLPVSIALFLLFLILIPVLLALAPALAFAKLGLNPVLGYLFFIVCLVGSGVNIPVSRQQVQYQPEDESVYMLHRYFGIRVPRFTERIIAVNLGGAVLPGVLSLYLLSRAPLEAVAVATAVMTAAAYALSKPVKGIGVVMPPFVPPIIAAVVAIVIAREHAPQVAYISGVVGTIIGADMLRLRQLREQKVQFLSIGGAGVFDGIYLVGLVSVLLA
jgi:uncharacterized membrane protein